MKIGTKLAWLAGVGFFGVVCFMAGRHSMNDVAEKNNFGDAVNVENAVAEAKVRSVPVVSILPANDGAKLPETVSTWDDKRWAGLMAEAGSPARNASLAEMLEKLGALNPDQAMKLAQAEGNAKLKEVLMQSALHGWARSAPTNAANWALNLIDSNARERALSTVFAGAVANDPAEALAIGKFVMAQNPTEAAGYGTRLIDALSEAGDFAAAAQMASGSDVETRAQWSGEAYSQWAQYQPEQAAEAASAITDPEARKEALHGIVGGWSEADPATLVQFVTQLPTEADRDALLGQSLQRWAKKDPKSAADWINNQPGGSGLDQGVATVATTESLPPDTAAAWAEYVGDPQLRSQTLVTVLRNWLTVDAAAAQNYFNSTTSLTLEDRQEITDVINAMSRTVVSQ